MTDRSTSGTEFYDDSPRTASACIALVRSLHHLPKASVGAAARVFVEAMAECEDNSPDHAFFRSLSALVGCEVHRRKQIVAIFALDLDEAGAVGGLVAPGDDPVEQARRELRERPE